MENNAQCNDSSNGGRVKKATDRKWSRATRGHHDANKALKEAVVNTSSNMNEGEGEGEDTVEIEKRIKTLKNLVPGGHEIKEIDTLFEETAEYIEALRGQLTVMKALAETIDNLGKDRRKFI